MIGNDAVGADAPGKIITIDGEAVGSAGKVVVGDYGTLTIKQDGSYTYKANSNNPEGVDKFVYKLSDFDGDTDTATLSITVTSENDVPVVTNSTKSVDETNGFDTVNGTVSVNFGDDPAQSIGANGTFSASDATFTSLGKAITVTNTGSTYTGKADGRDVFTLKINANGSYTFTQLDQIDHPVAGDANDVVTLNFGVKAVDADGDIGNGKIIINVFDDGPDARDDSNSAAESKTVSGNVITNDVVGADAPGKITEINGQAIGSGGKTISGSYGTLTINQNGSYSYKANSNNPNGTDKFTYKLVDFDGDTDTATLSIAVTPQNDVPVVTNASNNVDETNGFDSVTGNISVNYGTDGPGVTASTGAFSASDPTLTSLGQTINISHSGNTYTGTAGGRDVFKMVINSNGTYKFTQIDQIDHPNAGNANDIVKLNFGVKATDADGSVGKANVSINVYDDGPDARNDSNAAAEGKTVNGNVISNDVVGADAPGKIIEINGLAIGAGGRTITGDYGKLTINQNGSYSYKANSNNPNGTDTFTYKLADFDGDTDTATLSIRTTPIDSKPVAVDDRIPGGNKIYNGNVLNNDDFGGDGRGSPAIVDGTGTYNFPHGTITLRVDGSYTLNLNGSATYNHNYELKYTIQDSDGDTSQAILRFSVTPLVLDLDGDGIELTNVDNGVLFDYDVDGDVEQTAWVESDDGFLVIDNNGDGIINDRSEMFGDLFGFADGFAHLSSFDSNNDNAITSSDDQWADLQVWRDLNQDGITDEGELYGLDDLGITSIDLNAETTDTEVAGNYISATSTYTTADGVTHEIVDAHLDYEELTQEDQDKLDLNTYAVEESNDNSEIGLDDVLFTGGEDSVDAAILDFVHSTDAQDNAISVNAAANDTYSASSLSSALQDVAGAALATNDENIV